MGVKVQLRPLTYRELLRFDRPHSPTCAYQRARHLPLNALACVEA